MGKGIVRPPKLEAVVPCGVASNGLASLMKQWVKRLLVVFITWVVAGIVSAVLTGKFELPAWISGQSEHEKSVGIQELSNSTAPRLAEVGGMEVAKQEMWYNLIVPLKNPLVFFGGKPSLQAGRGILLFGPPGTGKTLLARAAARESGATFIAPTLAQLEAKYYGETAKIIQATFSVARRKAPSVIFFDEIDGMMRTRTSDEGCTYGLKTEMLRMLDSLKPSEPVMVVACTNSAAILDPALKRRLNVVIKVDLPSDSERLDILRICSGDDVPDANIVHSIVKKTSGFSGSDLHTAYKMACNLRLRRVLGEQKNGVDALLQTMPALTPHDWTTSVERVRSDKNASDVQSVGGIGSASDTLRDLMCSLKDRTQPATKSTENTADDEGPPGEYESESASDVSR